MQNPTRNYRGLFRGIAAGALAFGMYSTQAALSDGLVSYWPLEVVEGTKTPDLASGYDMNLSNLTATDVVDGKVGKAFSFNSARQTLLSRVHSEAEDLPATKHEAFTITFWANVTGTGQVDLRLFSEGFSPNNTTPLFNLGTDSGGANGTLDVFIRTGTSTEINHLKTTAEPMDGTWHHITYVQDADGTRRIYIDGVLDPLELPVRAAELGANNTSIGGIIRTSPSHWVTGLIDEVAIWKRALTEAEITQVVNEGLASIFPPEASGLVAHWPFEEIQGTKTPDLVNSYDMNLNNLTAADLVTGKVGKAFSFESGRQTLLSRIHTPAEDLPATKHEAYTISFWANATGTGQVDLRLFSEGFSPNNTTPLFNLGTDSGGANGTLDIFIRTGTSTEVNHVKTTGEPLDGTWHHIVFVQNADGTRSVYLDGALDPVEIPPKAAELGANNTSIGGIIRTSPSHWITGLIDEVAIWKRALTEAEINKIMTNGVPKVFAQKPPLDIRSFSADFPSVAAGGKVVLRWEGSSDATYSISGVGDVTAQTQFGVGSTEVTVPASTSYTLTATRGEETLSRQVEVKTVLGVATGWHLLDTFNFYTNGPVSEQSPWARADGLFNVVDLGTNVVMGFDDGNDLTALQLHTKGIPEGSKGTLSFRIYVVPTPAEELIAPINVHVGLTERSIRFVGDFSQNVGPYVRVERLADVDSIDLQARNGVATGFYEGHEIAALVPGEWYRIWIDVENKPFDVVDGVQNGGDVYSVHIQKEGEATRRTLFQNFVADRDAVTIDPALGAPTPHLTHVFVSSPGTGQLQNRVLLDDFFLTVGDYSSAVPYVPTSAPAADIRINAATHDTAAKKFTLTWSSAAGLSYTVQKKSSITAAWAPAGTVAATGASATFTDDANQTAAFYRVVHQP